MRYISIIFTLSICATAYLGDCIVFKSKYSSNQVFRAFADSSIHGAIGFWSSLLFFSYGINVTTQAWVCNVLFCSAMASLIDIDHFIVAKSLNLKVKSFCLRFPHKAFYRNMFIECCDYLTSRASAAAIVLIGLIYGIFTAPMEFGQQWKNEC